MAARRLLSTRPLLAHALVGGVAGLLLPPAVEVAHATAQAWRSQGDVVVVVEVAAEELAASALTGVVQGAAMRYWYPMVEGYAVARGTSPATTWLIKVLMDATPALVSTAG